MALRITGNITEAEPPAADPQSVVASLGVAARAALGTGELAGYRERYAEAGRLTDPQRRHQAEILLLEEGLRHAHGAGDAAAARTYAAVADAALESLDREPCEPLLLNYAGVACYELWALDAARALFTAAAHLDPALPDIERNRAEVARRMRGARSARPLHGSVPGLMRRARAISRRARPTRGLTLSLCMIVKDEERMLGRCLEAVRPAVDEIVVVDTGSSDATIEIARSHGARVIERAWTGSFADARNASFDAATGDWIVYLDADEVLVVEDAGRLRELTSHSWREAFSVIETSFVGELGEGTAVVNTGLRMFRNRPEYRFTGQIHEQIAHTLPSYVPDRIEHTSVRVEHYGYLGDVRAAKDKSARNLALLREQQRAAETTSPFLHFNLGCEHAAVGNGTEAVTELTRAWELLEAAGVARVTEYAPPILSTLTRLLRMGGRGAESIEWAQTGLEIFPDFTDLVMEQAAVAYDAGDAENATALCERCLELGDAPANYGGIVGTGTFLPRVALAQLALDRGDAPAAAALTDWCVTHHPEYSAVAGPYASAQLAAGVAPEIVVSSLEERLQELTPSARVALARALVQTGARGPAEVQYRRALVEGSPRSRGAVRAALAELLLGRGAFADAATVAAEIAGDDPYGGLGCRIETAARIAAHDLPGARTALARAADAGVPTGDREGLGAWIEAAAGGAPAELSLGGVPLLATLLEVMLRTGAGQSYALLRGLLESSRLPRRETRELLAGMHLRHGDLRAAATEWLAVCAEQPDARARLGLAQVATANGTFEDALLFADAALELDPACSEARALGERLRSHLATTAGAAPAGVDR